MKTGDQYRWFDSDFVRIYADRPTELTFDLAAVPDLHDVRELGVQVIGAAESGGKTAIYVDEVTLE